MSIDIIHEKGVPLERQEFNWRELVRAPISKLNDDAFARVRVILMNGIEQESNRFQHIMARRHMELRQVLAEIRRVEHHQQTLVNWLLPPDQSALETTIAYEQVAVEVTASVAQHEPDEDLKRIYHFGLLEDFDHLYRYSALLDRVEGKDANNILQSYTDIRPGRPTALEHRAPVDDLRRPYERRTAVPISKLNALTILAGENQTRDYYMNVGPTFADPVTRQVYAEIASIEEQHVTQYESILDPEESWLEQWMLHEATEAYNYYACLQAEANPKVKDIWQRFLDYELGHLHVVMDLFQRLESRDPAEVLPTELPEPIDYESHRDYVKQVLEAEVDVRAVGTLLVHGPETEASRLYREQMSSRGSPTEAAAAGYQYTPGTEVARPSRAGSDD